MKKFLVAGLGNSGPKYDNTRHNIGFKILDRFAQAHDLVFEDQRFGAVTTYRFKGRTFILLKPSTFMNLSGKAIRYWLNENKIPLENLLVLTDDINLNFGTLRLKGKGSDGGHNGLKNIQELIGTQKYARLRFGVGGEFSKGNQVNYVLGEWSQDEDDQLKERIEKCQGLIKSFGTAGLANTMNTYNGK
ncbi:MAG: aminoacyl-tRNA hydrolase [Psychroflexus sp.]|nr:aminoacyl-tRNA hydrolase [Psychroflexus sp.]MDN6309772.1 aminoacyl-tRNA hydrolase [Psychroflexus sp.]